jgi:UDP-N-acetylmuramoyl-tripeptide--D-alanyl-D-alanine ligase
VQGVMTMPLSEAAEVLNTHYSGNDTVFSGISTDTRSLSKGNLFVALQGPNFDGHNYLQLAAERGAAAVATSKQVVAKLPRLEVADTRIALGLLASHWRRRFEIPVVAITGSNGKTTVKEMLASILELCGPTLATAGNFNNDIGLPHTLLRLDQQHRFAVIELGANHPGEIDYLAQLTRPDVALVNNAAPAHLEGFGSLEGVAHAKGELFASLSENGIAIINADDPFASLWRKLSAQYSVIEFGLENRADITAQWQPELNGSRLQITTPAGDFLTALQVPGRHNVMNALAACAAAVALNIDCEIIAAGLAAFKSVKGRLQVQPGIHGSRLIDDTYNANPASLQAALDVLAEQPGQRWLVLGDMGELGEASEAMHSQVAADASIAGVSELFVLGELAEISAAAFGQGAVICSSMDELISILHQKLQADVTVLIKGSRFMHMERLVEALVDENFSHGEVPG